eukprot:3867664-Prymnesium_polylepis.1
MRSLVVPFCQMLSLSRVRHVNLFRPTCPRRFTSLHLAVARQARSSTPDVGQGQRPALRLGAGAALAGAPLNDLVAEKNGAIVVGERDPLGRPVVEVHGEVVLHAGARAEGHQRDRVPLGLGVIVVGIAP